MEMSIHILSFFEKTNTYRKRKKGQKLMIRDYNIHTDLALEDKERFESDQVEISGVEVEEVYNEEKEIQITTVRILTENGAKAMRKPVGTYITMEAPNLTAPDEAYQIEIAKEIANYLNEMINPVKEEYTVLVAGLGNREVTPDALGPLVVEELFITRHLVKEFGKFVMKNRKFNLVSAIAPGVMAQTGMETSEIVKGIVKEIQPDFVIAIDALAARNTKRLNRTIQITDTGINPGSGVGNHRNGITKDTIGIPVIAIGVPTVVDAATIIRDTMEHVVSELEIKAEELLLEQWVAPHLHGMFVTPKDIDETIARIGITISEALNILFQKELNS